MSGTLTGASSWGLVGGVWGEQPCETLIAKHCVSCAHDEASNSVLVSCREGPTSAARHLLFRGCGGDGGGESIEPSADSAAMAPLALFRDPPQVLGGHTYAKALSRSCLFSHPSDPIGEGAVWVASGDAATGGLRLWSTRPPIADGEGLRGSDGAGGAGDDLTKDNVEVCRGYNLGEANGHEVSSPC